MREHKSTLMPPLHAATAFKVRTAGGGTTLVMSLAMSLAIGTAPQMLDLSTVAPAMFGKPFVNNGLRFDLAQLEKLSDG